MTASAKPSSGRSKSNELRLADGEIAHVGVDVHKATYHVAVVSDQRDLVATWVQSASPEALIERLAPIAAQVALVVYEAGPTGYTLFRRLQDAGFRAEVVAPSKIPTMPGPEAKCDRLDCRKLAVFAQKCMLRAVRVPSPQEEADRQMQRLREMAVRKHRSIQQQIRSFLLQHDIAEPKGLDNWSIEAMNRLRSLELAPELRFCLDVMLDEKQHAAALVLRISRELEKLAKTERHQAVVDNLRTVPGVGQVTAMTFRVEMHEPSRFTDGRQVARMIGLAPQVQQSGTKRREGGILKSGNARLRAVLIEAAWRWIRSDAAAKRTYGRLVARTGSGKKAIVAMSRRLAILLWRLCLSGEPYRSGGLAPDPQT